MNFREAKQILEEVKNLDDSIFQYEPSYMEALETVLKPLKCPLKEVKHGKWEMKPDPYGFFDDIPVCSECGCTTKMREKTKYCPNCGTRMDK